MVHKYEVTMCTMYPIKENHQNGCHLKILVTVTDLTFDVNILGALVHICTKNEYFYVQTCGQERCAQMTMLDDGHDEPTGICTETA